MEQTISTQEATKLKLQIITVFRPEIGVDLSIRPEKKVQIGTKENPRIVDCNISKGSRKYNHFEWLEKLKKHIEKDGDRAYIVQAKNHFRALAIK